jgi:outer membrane protein
MIAQKRSSSLSATSSDRYCLRDAWVGVKKMRGMGKGQRGLISTVGMLLALLLPIAGAAQTPKIGYVDMKRLIDNAPQVAEGRKRIEAEFLSRDQLLKAEQTRLNELEARERRDSAVLPKAEADALRLEIQTRKRSIELTRSKLNLELKARSDQELSRRWPELTDAVIEYARTNGYDLVVPAPVLYASASVDITDEVLAALRTRAASSGNP